MEDYKRQPIGIGITDFRNLRTGNALYIDKTEYMWNLLQLPGNTFFMARPRRFGKTMFLSALKYLFLGKKELFEGLAIAEKGYDWKIYPVIFLDFGACNTSYCNTKDKLNAYLARTVRSFAEGFHVTLPESDDCAELFRSLIVSLCEKSGPVVILIDEYDKPVTDTFYSDDAEGIIDTMKNFYSVIKSCNPYERFVFVTGVTKIALTTFYSAFNNPQDISMDANYAAMLGYTQDELEKYFGDRVADIAAKKNTTADDLYKKIKHWYNGYCFCEKTPTVYNPVSLGYFFVKDGKFSNYWIDTGTPSILLKAVREQRFNLLRALEKQYPESVFKSFDLGQVSIMGLLVQTGYLTIKDFTEENESILYTLGFPNDEVSLSFREYLVRIWANMPNEQPSMIFNDMRKGILTEDLELIQSAWEQVFSHFIYDLRDQIERAYQTVFYVFGLIVSPGKTAAEQHTNRGRTDAVIETDKAVYIFEFKVDAPIGEHAVLKQVYEKDYGSRYNFDGKHVYAIGINFSRENGNIAEYEAIPYGEFCKQ